MADQNKFPKLSESATEEEINLPLEDKLKLIDAEIRQLYDFCSKAGYTHAEINSFAQPLLTEAKGARKAGWLKFLIFVVVLVGFVALLFYFDPTYRQICITGKLMAMKVLPYWDWTYIYDQDCLIDNPYYEGSGLTEEDCNRCKELRVLQRLSNATQEEVSNKFLFAHTPFVVTDAIDGWEAPKKFSIDFLAELYDSNSVLKTSEYCQFESTHLGYTNPRDLLMAVTSGDILDDIHSYWENCAKEAAKVFRKFYKRPYFLPPMAEATEGNWLIVSRACKKSLKVSWDGSATWLAQIKGSAKVTLTPTALCGDICHKVQVTLQPGETVTVTNEMWALKYYPLGTDDVIALGSAVSWDV